MLRWPAIIGAIANGVFCVVMRYDDHAAPAVGAAVIMALSLWDDRARVKEAMTGLIWGGALFVALVAAVQFLTAAGLIIGTGWLLRAAFHISN